MNLKQLSDKALLADTELLARQEREILTLVLHHLREINRRRLFSALGYKSLFDYCVRKLGYSSDQAGRRVSAMKLMISIPEVEKKIESGALTLTHLGMARNWFRKEEVPKARQIEMLKALENTSTREAERIILNNSSDPMVLRPDRIRLVAAQKIEIRFVADESLNKKLDTVKGLLAHTKSPLNMAELIDKLCDISIAKLRPSTPPTKANSAAPLLAAPKGHRVTKDEKVKKIPKRIRRLVWERAENKCEKCSSELALQIDHIRPRAHGGSDDPENLRLLCRQCNQRAAIEQLGLEKMDPYLNGRADTC